ncbi:fungal-specific transcription factor domain-containing protein [Fennellomyces sp. T-0311]|nr:fungal-specific transcription factor domain-containing protein [Fennellomyces sp. T-0311]
MDPSTDHHSSPESSTPEPTKKTKKGAAATNTASNQNRRSKSMRACDECRKRKVKCDGVQPCSKCRKSEIPCVFAKLPPKRGPPKQYIELLEARLHLIEKALRTIDGPARRILDDALALDSVKALNSPSSQEDAMEASVKEEDEGPSVSSAAPCSPTPQSIDEADRFSINEIGQAMYVNDIKARIDRIPSIHNSDANPMSFGKQSPHKYSADNTADSPQKMDTDAASEASSSVPTALPHDVPQSLIKTYFAQVHKYVPMIHNPYFYKQLANKTDPPSPLLLYAMCAVASRWTGDYTGASSGQIAPGFLYYQRAFAKIDEYSDAPRVSTIQALVLLTKYQEYYRRLGFFHRPGLYLGMAVRMCNDLGLPKLDPAPGPDEDPQEYEEKKRTFWMVFIYDLMMSIEQGREPYFANIECTTEYPLATSEEGPYLEEVVTNNNVVIQLARILSDILLMSRRVTTRQHAQGDQRSQVQIIEEQGKLFLLNTHLENFVHELPASLTYAPTQNQASYPVDKQPINNVFVGFLHMTFHCSMILLHRHYVLHPLPPCDIEMEPYPHQQLCASSASNITQIAETILESQAMDAFSYPTRGIQHTIHCVTMAATVHREEMASHDKAIADNAKQQYLKSLNILNRLAAESPAMEFHSHIKEAELAQMYGRMAVDPNSNSNNSSSNRAAPAANTTAAFSSPVHSSNTSTTSSTDSNFVSSAPPQQQAAQPQQSLPPDRVSLSDASSTSSSPVLSSSVDMPTRPARTIKLPASRRHTLTGTGNTQLMQMAKHAPPGQYHLSHQPTPGSAMPYLMDATAPFSQASLLNSSAAISDPSRFASLMMQPGVNIPLYNHHQQPLPHMQQPQQQQPQQQQPQHHHPHQPHFVSPNTYRKSRLSHHVSYSQEDLRSLRRAQMNKPIGGGGNWPPAQARSSPHASDFGYGSTYTDLAHHDGFPNPYPQQQQRMTRQLRRQSSMTAMMPSYYAQRQQQQQYMPPAPIRHAPPAPPPRPQVTQQQQQQQQAHHRRHTISVPASGPNTAVAPPPGYSDPASSMMQPMDYINYSDSAADSMMNVDSLNKLDDNDYLGLQVAAETTPSSAMDSMMMVDPPTNDDAAQMMNEFLMNEQWPMLVGSNTSTTSNPGFEDLQRSEGHVM